MLGAGGSCSCRYDHVSTAQAQQVYTVHCTVTVHCAPWPWLSRVRTQHPPQRWPEDFPRAVSMSIVTYGPMFKIGFQIPLPSTLSSATTDCPCRAGEYDSVCTLHAHMYHELSLHQDQEPSIIELHINIYFWTEFSEYSIYIK